MQHYVCNGECAGESENAGACQDETCSRHGQPLLECKCGDGLHQEVLAASDSSLLEPDIEDEESYEL